MAVSLTLSTTMSHKGRWSSESFVTLNLFPFSCSYYYPLHGRSSDHYTSALELRVWKNKPGLHVICHLLDASFPTDMKVLSVISQVAFSTLSLHNRWMKLCCLQSNKLTLQSSNLKSSLLHHGSIFFILLCHDQCVDGGRERASQGHQVPMEITCFGV